MKIAKYAAATVFAALAIWFLISTWMDIQAGINGPIHIKIGTEDEFSSTPTSVHLARWRSQAQFKLLSETTNITGFRRIIESQISDYDSAISNWTGTATAEYINAVGGVERTNIYYLFSVSAGELKVAPDYFLTAYNAARRQ